MSGKCKNIRKRRKETRRIRRKATTKSENSLFPSNNDKLQPHVKFSTQTSAQNSYQSVQNITQDDSTFSALLKRWQQANEVRLKGGTRIRYDNIINSQIIPELGNLSLSELTPSVINQFLSNKLANGRIDGKGGLSASYVRSISLVITSALNYGVLEDLVPSFRTKINKPSIVKKELPILSNESQKALEQYLKANSSPTNIGIMISLYTGLRIGEVCALCWDDIDFINQTIFVRHTISRVKSSETGFKTELILDEPKTLSSKRLIPIPSTLFAALLNYRKEAKSKYVVSSTESFVSPRTYDSRFHRVTRDCNIGPINYHGLRHTFATRCVEAGVDIKTLSEILGHSDVSTTLNTYVHSTIEMKRSQLEKLVRL